MKEDYRRQLESVWQEGSRDLTYDVWRSCMEQDYKTVLQKRLPDLAKNISTDSGFLGHLQSKLIFDRRSIDGFQRKHGKYDQLSAILNALNNKPFDNFIRFCEVLIETNQIKVISDFLTPDELGTRIVQAVAVQDFPSSSTGQSKAPKEIYRNVPKVRKSVQFDWRDAIRVNYPRLTSEIHPDNGLIEKLVERGIISETNVDRITTTKGRSNRVEAILDHLTRSRPDEDFLEFCEVLRDTDQQHIVALYLTKESSSSPSLPRSQKVSQRVLQLPQPVSNTIYRLGVNRGWKKVLTNRRSTLVEKMNVSDDLISKLQSLGVLNQNTGERFQEEIGDRGRAESLIDYMQRRSSQDFGFLCQALYETGQRDLVDSILRLQHGDVDVNATDSDSNAGT